MAALELLRNDVFFLDEQFSLSAVLGARRAKRAILGPKFSE